jgi:GNAT superfamily N-acetyltransferase
MGESNSITLRAMVSGDLLQAHRLSQAVGWGHRLEDWQMMFDLGRGFVGVDRGGVVQGVGLWWPFGEDYATLGMIIVSPQLQRSGIGRGLMESILAAAGARRVQLNATSEGLRLYESMQFVPASKICTHVGSISGETRPVLGGGSVREIRASDWPVLRNLDRRASSMDRTGLLDALARESRGFVAESGDRISGYVLCRQFGRAKVLGPLVAEGEQSALALLSSAAIETRGVLRADIPEDASLLARWLIGANLPQVGQVQTMWRGGAPSGDGRTRVFGLASQALG